MTSPKPSSRSALELVSRALRAFLQSVPGRLITLGLLGWGTFNLWNWVTTESVEEQRAGDSSSPIKIQVLNPFTVFKDGKKHWEVAADSAQVVDSGDAWLALGVSRATLFRDEQRWITMSAPRVRLSNLSKNLDAVGGVKASGPEGFIFETPQARWLDAKKLVEIPGTVRASLREMQFSAPNLFYQWEKGELESAGPVEVRVKGGVLRGKGMKTFINTRRVELGRDVELIFTPGVATLPQPFAAPAPAITVKPAATKAATVKPAAFRPAVAASPGAAEAENSMSRSPLFRATLAVSLAAPSAFVLVQAPAPKSALAAPSAQTPGNVVIDAGQTSYTDGNGVAVLSGGVKIAEVGKEFSLVADDVVYSQPKSQASATGNLKVTTRNSTIRGGKLFGDFNKKVLSISDNVVISAYDKGDGMSGFRSSGARKPVRIACDRLDWNYVTRQATLIGNLRIVQDDNSGTCNSIVFDEPKNVVTLRGNVRFRTGEGDQLIGNEVTILVDKGQVIAPNIRIRSGLDAPAKSNGAAPKAPPPIKFEAPRAPAIGAGNVTLPQAPPPIESLIPPSKPMERPRPKLPPTETTPPAAKAPAPAAKAPAAKAEADPE